VGNQVDVPGDMQSVAKFIGIVNRKKARLQACSSAESMRRVGRTTARSTGDLLLCLADIQAYADSDSRKYLTTSTIHRAQLATGTWL
jgi:hypothetical protein